MQEVVIGRPLTMVSSLCPTAPQLPVILIGSNHPEEHALNHFHSAAWPLCPGQPGLPCLPGSSCRPSGERWDSGEAGLRGRQRDLGEVRSLWSVVVVWDPGYPALA